MKVGRKVALEVYRHYSAKLEKYGSLGEADQLQFDQAREALAAALAQGNASNEQISNNAGPPPVDGNSFEEDDLPEVHFSLSALPELATNILHALKAGHPSVLSHLGDRRKKRANRRAATNGVPSLAGYSRDEYPFASSREGGSEAWVGHVPQWQQSLQGELISELIRTHKLKPGDRYRVVIIP